MGGFRQRGMVGMVGARSVQARVGGCLELEFREFEELDIRFCHTRGQGPADYPVRCARQAATVPNLRLEIEESCFKNQSNSDQNWKKNR